MTLYNEQIPFCVDSQYIFLNKDGVHVVVWKFHIRLGYKKDRTSWKIYPPSISYLLCIFILISISDTFCLLFELKLDFCLYYVWHF